MRRLGLLFIFLITSSLAFGQQGAISGKVTDKKTGEGVIGATVLVTGTVQAAPVDVQGTYELKLDPGTYNITMTYIGYKPLTFAGIVVTANGQTTLNGVMEENTTNLKEVTVTGQKQTGTEVAMIQDLKKSEVVVSGMSNDQIVKTLDRDAAEVVKRIPGVTIQNNSFIVIRGLAERYNTVLLNDALTPSIETDTRSFSFDILPSSVIDRVLIFKSGAPELPGEFGGGVVKVYTKNSVLENSTSLSVSGWARSTNTFKEGFQSTDHSSTDWLGADNGQRQLPGSVADITTKDLTADQLQNIKQEGALRNEWLPRITTSRPDLRFSLGLNRHFDLGSTYISNVTSVSYSNTQEQVQSTRQRYMAFNKETNATPDFFYNFQDTRSTSAARLGIIHNWQVRLSDRNTLEFRNFFNQYGTDEVTHRVGVGYEASSDGADRDNYALHYQSRTLYSGQLGGKHDLGQTGRNTVTWAAGYNYVFRNEPDYRQFQRERSHLTNPDTGEMDPFRVVVNADFTNSSRFFADLKENTYMVSGQWEHRFLNRRDTTSARQYKLRAGFYSEVKNRAYNSRYFNYVIGRLVKPARAAELRAMPIETIFSPQNLDLTSGFSLQESTNPQDRYDAENELSASYLSAVAPITDQFNLSGGVRVEYNRKYVKSGDPVARPYEEKKTVVLPSLNATYNFTDRSLLRLASSTSVNRPEFREVAEYQYYDFANNFYIRGDSSLKTATIYNGDLRYEFYPSRAELLSVGVFYKHFTNAIEQVTRATTGTDLLLTYQNADQAYDVGIEVEARKSLATMSENAFLQHFSFVLNASLIRSRVQLDTTKAENKDFALTDRPLQGQSPYVINFGTFYQDDERHWQVSAQYNLIGPRIAFVGDRSQNYSVIELPRHVVDVAVTKGVGKHLEVRAGIQNMLNQLVRQNYDFNRNGKIDSFENGSFARYKRGTYNTLGLTYRF
jgi:TonB-dependent receptor